MSDMWPLQLSLVKSRLGLDQLLRAHCKKESSHQQAIFFLTYAWTRMWMLKQILKSINIANRKSLCFVTVFLSCDFKIWYYYFNGYFLQRAFSSSSQHFPDTCSLQTHLLRGIKSSARRNEISSRNSETTSKFVVGSTDDLLSNGDVPNPNNIKFSS